MDLLPEFFIILGSVIFLGLSLIAFLLLSDQTPHLLGFLYQGAAALGIGEMLLSKFLVDGGVFSRDPSDPSRFWISIVYLAAALFNVIGLNVYLGVVKREGLLASAFSGAVSVPTLMVSVFLASYFLGAGGAAGFTPDVAYLLAVAIFVSGISLFGFLRQASRHFTISHHEQFLVPTSPSPMTPRMNSGSAPESPSVPGIVFSFQLPSKSEDEWEESPRKRQENSSEKP